MIRIGHVHLKVGDLGRAESFYVNLLGARVTERVAGDFAFLSMGEAHHEVALQALGPSAQAPAAHSLGLYHSAFEVSDGAGLLRAVDKLEDMGVDYTLVDHGISWALYCSDPDGNGVEIFLDRRKKPGGAELWHGSSRRLSREDIE